MRIIAGELGGRRLVAPRGLATRPTTDRAREALFSILGDVQGARVLDLYAGTGALGIEALSRGAARATFVESARPAIVALRENLRSLGLDPRAAIVAQPVARALDAIARAAPFDLVFADPPYADAGSAAELIARLVVALALAPGARVVLERSSRDAPFAIEGLALASDRTYGDTAIAFYDVATVSRVGDG